LTASHLERILSTRARAGGSIFVVVWRRRERRWARRSLEGVPEEEEVWERREREVKDRSAAPRRLEVAEVVAVVKEEFALEVREERRRFREREGVRSVAREERLTGSTDEGTVDEGDAPKVGCGGADAENWRRSEEGRWEGLEWEGIGVKDDDGAEVEGCCASAREEEA
jgi:hypothetical protein